LIRNPVNEANIRISEKTVAHSDLDSSVKCDFGLAVARNRESKLVAQPTIKDSRGEQAGA